MRIRNSLQGLIAIVPLMFLSPHQSEAGSYKVIYNFDGSVDGKGPMALVPFSGALYGVTYLGGANKKGTIFVVTPSGAETIIHSFGATENDGVQPTSLVALGSDLFGITAKGGSGGNGTVFRVTNGKFAVIHSFSGGVDGTTPEALTVFKGSVYGVTLRGGTIGSGTLYKISRKGEKTVIYNFGNEGVTGPELLVSDRDSMFGGGQFGGTNNVGIVFAASADGVVKVIHNFDSNDQNDGYYPSGMVAVGDTLYCLTASGGQHDKGAFVSFSSNDSENLLYSFGTAPIGDTPQYGLSKIGGLFYGATQQSEETLFSLTAKGRVSDVVTFPNTDNVPSSGRGGVVDLGGTLYGITYEGGNSAPPGRGTVYSVGP